MWQLSPAIGFEWGEADALPNPFPCRRQPHGKEFCGQNVNSTKKLRKPLLTHSISHSTFSIWCTNLYLRFGCVFTFLEIIKHNMLKMLCTFFIHCTKLFLHLSSVFTCLEIIKHNVLKILHIFFHLSIKMATQKFTILIF